MRNLEISRVHKSIDAQTLNHLEMGKLPEMLSSLFQVEELQPGFSKAGRVYISKVKSPVPFTREECIILGTHSGASSPLTLSLSPQCCRELGKNSEARRWMKLALELPDVTKEVGLLKCWVPSEACHNFNAVLGQHWFRLRISELLSLSP